MTAIYKRELKAYFHSAIGYVFLTVFFAVSGFMVFFQNIIYNYSNLANVFYTTMLACIVLIPVLSMRLLSEERKQKTDQALLTAPVSLTGIVLGKFFAAMTIYAIGLSVTIVYAVVMSFFGTIQGFVFVGDFVGMLLFGAAFIAIGTFISSLTESQIVAAIGSIVLLLALFLVDMLSAAFTGTTATAIISFFSVSTRMSNLFTGVLNVSDIVFFLSLAAVFLFLSIRKLESRRWS